jgi:hypothetical protein
LKLLVLTFGSFVFLSIFVDYFGSQATLE